MRTADFQSHPTERDDGKPFNNGPSVSIDPRVMTQSPPDVRRKTHTHSPPQEGKQSGSLATWLSRLFWRPVATSRPVEHRAGTARTCQQIYLAGLPRTLASRGGGRCFPLS